MKQYGEGCLYAYIKYYTMKKWDSAGIAPCMSGLIAAANWSSGRQHPVPFQLPSHLANSLVTTLTKLSLITT